MAVCVPPDVFLCEGGGKALDLIYEGERCRGSVLTCRMRVFHKREGREELKRDPEMLAELAGLYALVKPCRSPSVGINQANEEKACTGSSLSL